MWLSQINRVRGLYRTHNAQINLLSACAGHGKFNLAKQNDILCTIVCSCETYLVCACARMCPHVHLTQFTLWTREWEENKINQAIILIQPAMSQSPALNREQAEWNMLLSSTFSDLRTSYRPAVMGNTVVQTDNKKQRDWRWKERAERERDRERAKSDSIRNSNVGL